MVAQDFDDILDQIGGFGRFQKILCTLSFFLVIPAAMITYTPMFILTVPKHRCALEGYQGDTYAVQNDHHLELINASIPLNDDGNMHKCNILTGNEDLWNSSVPAGNATGVAQCTKWVYDKTMFDRSLIEKVKGRHYLRV
ncbi:steroid transmembrane transporter SLC22A24 [Aplysia californica]|uniref:Steroid transmembrane transporter SLC22A24 n=1 Tax=Aplysia californica TaxID=6500 RepID=A0ABM1VUF4_APLCA|nr:steroid transmembrane transporter SLC22A24 [Aplysia californica]